MKKNTYDKIGLILTRTIAFISAIGFIYCFLESGNVWMMLIASILSYLFIWSLEK